MKKDRRREKERWGAVKDGERETDEEGQTERWGGRRQ